MMLRINRYHGRKYCIRVAGMGKTNTHLPTRPQTPFDYSKYLSNDIRTKTSTSSSIREGPSEKQNPKLRRLQCCAGQPWSTTSIN